MTSIKKACVNFVSNLSTHPITWIDIKSSKCYAPHRFCSLFGYKPTFQNVLPLLARNDMLETGRNDWQK